VIDGNDTGAAESQEPSSDAKGAAFVWPVFLVLASAAALAGAITRRRVRAKPVHDR
jgi:hypothetical protein